MNVRERLESEICEMIRTKNIEIDTKIIKQQFPDSKTLARQNSNEIEAEELIKSELKTMLTIHANI